MRNFIVLREEKQKKKHKRGEDNYFIPVVKSSTTTPYPPEYGIFISQILDPVLTLFKEPSYHHPGFAQIVHTRLFHAREKKEREEREVLSK